MFEPPRVPGMGYLLATSTLVHARSAQYARSTLKFVSAWRPITSSLCCTHRLVALVTWDFLAEKTTRG